MKFANLVLALGILAGATTSFADLIIIQDGTRYSCTAIDSSNHDDDGSSSRGACAEASIEKSGYVYNDCSKVVNAAQDSCAAASIRKSGYVYNDCLKLEAGGRCAEASIVKSGYVYNDCMNVKNAAQDRCAAASVQKSGYVYSDCLQLK